jgi:hypothetical protein
MRIAKPPRPRNAATNVGADYTPDELEFLHAIDRYKRKHRRPFPAWSEVLQVLLSLGYRKQVTPPPAIPAANAAAGEASWPKV